MGTGKTRTAIEIIKQKCAINNRNLRTLILAPQVVCYNWVKEFDQFSVYPTKQIIVLNGTGINRVKQLQRTPSYFVVVANYESLLMDQVFAELRTWRPEVIVADESHRLKNPRAKRSKRAIALSATASYRLALTGTPILQNQADLFSQFLFLDHGERLGKNFFLFRQKYFYDANQALRQKNKMVSWPNWKPKPGMEHEFNEKVHSIALAVKKDECLDLPPLIEQTIEVEMSPEQKTHYKTMRDDYITFVQSKAFTAQLAVTKALRLNQIANGFVQDGEDRHSFKITPKDKALMELLEDITPNHKVVIWACWKENHARISNLLADGRYKFRLINGDTSVADRERSLADFRDDPDIRVLVGSQSALGIGINLVESSHAIFYSRNFSLEADLQAAARTYRGGSERHKSVHRIDLVTKDTIDASVIEALKLKQEIGDNILSLKV